MLEASENTPALSVAGDLEDLIEALEFVRYAICYDKVRPYLEGIRLDWERDGLRVAATDGHRMHVTVLPYNAPDHAERLFLLKAEDVSRLLKTYGRKRARKGVTFVLDYATNQLRILDKNLTPFLGWQPENRDRHLRSGARPPDWSACWPDLNRVIPKDPPPVFTADTAAFVSFFDAITATSGHSCVVVETEPDKDDGNVKLSCIMSAGKGYSLQSLKIEQDGIQGAEVCKTFTAGYTANYVRDFMRAFGESSRLYLMADDSSSPAIWYASASQRPWHNGKYQVRKDRFVILMPCRI